MSKEEINKIISKYLDNNISEGEEKLLLQWIKNPKNEEKLKAYISVNYLVNKNFKTFNGKMPLEDFFKSTKSKKVKRLFNTTYIKYAAVILIFFSVGYYFLVNDSAKFTKPVVVNNNIKTGTDKAVLTLEDGTDIALEKDQNYTTNNMSSNGKELTYKPTTSANETETPTIAYNYLTIPRGGEYFIKLSDGTKVWLNSESQLKYPVSFKLGEPRIVELVYGEVYLDVSPSKAHNGSPFRVIHKMQNLEVLGTEFNVKAYKDETEVVTTLVEGSIAVSNNSGSKILTPNQQSIINSESDKIAVSTVEVAYEISWKKGDFSFYRKSLKDIMKVLSRWYNVDVSFENKALEDVKFVGEFGKNQNIEEILLLIQETNIINAYEINGNKIIIK